NQFQLPADLSQEPFYDGESQSGATDAGACGFPSREGTKQALDIGRGDACTLIFNLDGKDIALLSCDQLDMSTAIRRCTSVPTRIFDEVADYALEVVRIDLGVQVRLDRCGQRSSQGFCVAAFAFIQVAKHGGDVDTLFRNHTGRPCIFHELPD